jgi:hypothetical protein
MTGRGRIKMGDIVRIPLPDGTFGYGHVLVEPLVAFLNYRDDGQCAEFAEIVNAPALFRVWVANEAFGRGKWRVVGHVGPTAEAVKPVYFFRQDAISGAVTITHDGSTERPATIEDARGLERAAVWASHHVAERLLDHFERRPNKWVRSLDLR